MDNVPDIIKATGIAIGAILIGGSTSTVVILKMLLPNLRKYRLENERHARKAPPVEIPSVAEVSELRMAVCELRKEVQGLSKTIHYLCNELSAMTGKPFNIPNKG